MVQIILTSGTSWTVPSDWNSANNTIEAIGGGGGGDNEQGSGGGGQYAKIINFAATAGASIPITIGAGGLGAAAGSGYIIGTDGGDTKFNTTSLIAKGGGHGDGNPNGGTGGTGTTLFDGGSGNTLYNSSGGGGGGGAGGPNGKGGQGGQDAYLHNPNTSLFGAGGGAGGANGTTGGAAGGNTSDVAVASGGVGVSGSGSGGAGGDGTAGVQDGSPGIAGTYWGTAGPGGGGGGGGTNTFTDGSGAVGGLYGGGGGAAAFYYGRVNTPVGGAGAQGCLVITYTPGVAAPVTWNPADKDIHHTLSNGNRTTTSSAGSGVANSGIRATVSIPVAIKTYFELAFTSTASAQYLTLGAMSGTASLTVNMGAGNGAGFCNKFGGANNSYIYISGTANPNGFPQLNNGDVLRVAIDRTANKIWWAINNTAWTTGATPWMGSGGITDNPVTGTGGASIAGVAGTLYPSLSSAWTGDAVTINGGAAGFAFAVPSGFFPLDPVITNAQVTQVGLEEWLTTNAPAQVTQVALEQWASVAAYVPPVARKGSVWVMA